MQMAALYFRERMMEATDLAEEHRAAHKNLVSVYEKSPDDMDAMEIAEVSKHLTARLTELKVVEMQARIQEAAACTSAAASPRG